MEGSTSVVLLSPGLWIKTRTPSWTAQYRSNVKIVPAIKASSKRKALPAWSRTFASSQTYGTRLIIAQGTHKEAEGVAGGNRNMPPGSTLRVVTLNACVSHFMILPRTSRHKLLVMSSKHNWYSAARASCHAAITDGNTAMNR
eukprot:6481043-Amphidinium_carterae.1